MTLSNLQIQWNCIMIERMITKAILSGNQTNEELVRIVEDNFYPQSEFEMESYSEAIIYAKLSLLN